MSPVILNAANVKLEFVSNAVSPRWLHHAGSETWRTTGVAQTAEKLANATIKEDNVVNILKGDVCVKQIEGYGVTVLTFRTFLPPSYALTLQPTAICVRDEALQRCHLRRHRAN